MKTIVLENDKLHIEILSLGATLLSFKHKKDGQNIVVRYQDLKTYRNDTGPYLNACIGPVAGRVAKGAFGNYNLSLNAGTNHLHGGIMGIHDCDFSVESTPTKAIFTSRFDHKTDGYPGYVRYEITYSLDDETLILDLKGFPEVPHYLNLTNHAYFNLDGSTSIRDHKLHIDTHWVGCLDATSTFKGGLLDVSDTVLDFRGNPALEKTLVGKHPQFAFTRNLDHMFFVSELDLSCAQKHLHIKTDAPGFQVYAANYFDDTFKDEYGRLAQRHAGLAIEPQRPANEINFNPDAPEYSSTHPFVTQTRYTLTFDEA